MRAVKAKQLRAIANYAGKRGLVKCTYLQHNHKPKFVPSGELHADGSQKLIKVVPFTIKLGECTRKIYKSLKKAQA